MTKKTQMQAEDAVITERNRLYELFKQAPAAIAVVGGPQHTYELANKLYQKVFHRTEKELLGRTIKEVFPEIAGQKIYELFDTVFTTGKPFIGNEFPATFDRQGNGKFEQGFFNFVAQPIHNESGNVERILIHAVETTEQVKARKTVEEQNRVLEMITSGTSLSDALDFLLQSVEKQSPHNMKASILLLDTDGLHLRHGAAPSLAKGYNEAIDGIAIGPDVGSCGTAAFMKKPVVVSDIATDPLWKDFKALAHQYHLRSCWSTPIFSSKQQLLGTFAMYYNEPHTPDAIDRQIIDFATRTAGLVIERKNMEEAMQENAERFRTLANNIQNLAWMANADGWLFWYNKRWYEYTGTNLEEMQGWGWKKVHHPDHLNQVVSFMKEAWEKGEPFELTIPLKRHDGMYQWFLTRAFPVKDNYGNVVRWIGTNTNVDDQKKALEQKDEFLGIASHELKTPVTSIKAYTQVLLARFKKAEDVKSAELIGKMDRQLNKLVNLIADLLDVTKIDAGKLQFNESYFDLNELVEEIVEETQRTTEKHTIIPELAKTKTICGDRDRLGQVIINFLTNAIKYSPDTHKIIVRTKTDKENITLSVQDFGIGISKDMQNKVFERFYRVDEQETYPGLGLGLYFSAEVIKRQGGKIWVKSEKGKGSLFSFSLPLKSVRKGEKSASLFKD